MSENDYKDYIIITLQVVNIESNGSDGYNFPDVLSGDLANETLMLETITLRKSYLEKSSTMFNYNHDEYTIKLSELIEQFKDFYLKLKRKILQILPLLYYKLSQVKINSGVLRVSKFDYTQHNLKFVKSESFILILNDAFKLLNSVHDGKYNLSILILTSLIHSFKNIKNISIRIPLKTLYGESREEFKSLSKSAQDHVVKFKYVTGSKKKEKFLSVVDF